MEERDGSREETDSSRVMGEGEGLGRRLTHLG